MKREGEEPPLSKRVLCPNQARRGVCTKHARGWCLFSHDAEKAGQFTAAKRNETLNQLEKDLVSEGKEEGRKKVQEIKAILKGTK